MARLVVLSEGFTGRSYDLKADQTTVGRLDDNAFHIPDGSVSSHHCIIHLRGGEVFVQDLNSTNGTFVNGNQITGEAPVKPGQILRLGQIEIRLESGDPKPAQKKLEQTIVIPRGVSLSEADKGQKPVNFDKDSPFGKKKDSGKLFLIGAVVLGVIIIALIVILLMQSPQPE